MPCFICNLVPMQPCTLICQVLNPFLLRLDSAAKLSTLQAGGTNLYEEFGGMTTRCDLIPTPCVQLCVHSSNPRTVRLAVNLHEFFRHTRIFPVRSTRMCGICRRGAQFKVAYDNVLTRGGSGALEINIRDNDKCSETSKVILRSENQ